MARQEIDEEPCTLGQLSAVRHEHIDAERFLAVVT
jgi:hypothetical protein